MKRLLQTSLMIFMFTGLSTVALAQVTGSANTTASATVEPVVNVNWVSDLTFGPVTLNSTTRVSASDAGAGSFTVEGNSKSTTLDFTLPTNLTFTDGGGTTYNLPISYAAGDAAWGNGSPTNTWNPDDDTQNPTVSIADNGGSIDVYIGGSVTTSTTQAPGTYEGTITLTATHN